MRKNPSIVTVIGGTGFLGRYVVHELAQAGYTVRVLSRHPEQALHLKTAGAVGQIVLERADITRPASLSGKFAGSFAVINLTGIMFESGKQNFTNVHTMGAEAAAREAWQSHVSRYMHISALGAPQAVHSQYARSKAAGEKAVANAFSGATIIRPSVLFGPEDNFYNMFARMAAFMPFLPLIGGGKTKLQPVYVGDVARAIVCALEKETTKGNSYELGGPEVKTLQEIMESVARYSHQEVEFESIPFWLAGVIGWFAGLLPRPLLTADQVQLLRHDNIVVQGAKGFKDLGIAPTSVEMIVPQYLARYSLTSAEKMA